ncbi:MAG: hypothetical protein JSR58_05245 [Verrucomicrobia bacterium]|nr:hypothetical protein [Verrucomicrobiota bacterium]
MRVNAFSFSQTFLTYVGNGDNKRISEIAIHALRRMMPSMSQKSFVIGAIALFSLWFFIFRRVPRNVLVSVGGSKPTTDASGRDTSYQGRYVVKALERLPVCNHGKNIYTLIPSSNYSNTLFEEGDGGFEHQYEKIQSEIDNSVIFIIPSDKDAEGYYAGFQSLVNAQGKLEALTKQFGSRVKYYELKFSEYQWINSTGLCPLWVYREFLKLKSEELFPSSNKQ